MISLIPARTFSLLISEILLIVGSFVLACYYVLPADPSGYLLFEGGMISVAVSVLSILIGLYLQDLYSDIYVTSKLRLLQKLILGIGVAFVVQGMVSYLDRELRISIRIMIVGGFLTVVLLFVWRILYTAYLLPNVGGDRLLFVGGSAVLLDIARHVVGHPEMGLTVTGYVDNVHKPDAELPGGKILGPVSALPEIVKATRPTRLVVGMPERRNGVPMAELLDLRYAGHLIEEAATAYERVCGRVCIKELRPSQLIYTGELGPRRQTLRYQNLYNLVVASLAIVPALFLMVLTARAVRLSSPGPILYRQIRIGMYEVPFTLYKFRSMRVDAEAETGAVWAIKDDPRITRVGRIIRKIRLDELPQLFNVLKGEMAIVGPRPDRPEFVKALSEQIPYYRQRHSVRPGITGWAQINYKYGDTLEDTMTKLEYDLLYIKNMSVRLDSYIIFHTLKAMLLSRGAQ